MTFQSVQNGEREQMVELPDAAVEECPASLLSRHPQMEAMVMELLQSERVREATGAVPFGPDTSKWPARWHDAVMLAHIERKRLDAAIDKMSRQIS